MAIDNIFDFNIWRYMPPLSVYDRGLSPFVTINSVIGDDDTWKYWGTLRRSGPYEFEFTRDKHPDKKISFDYPTDNLPGFWSIIRQIELDFSFELRGDNKRQELTIAGYSPYLKRLVDEAYALQFEIGQRYIQAKYHEGPGDPDRLDKIWQKAQKRYRRRYYGKTHR